MEMAIVFIDFANGESGWDLRAQCALHNISINNIVLSFLGGQKGGDAWK